LAKDKTEKIGDNLQLLILASSLGTTIFHEDGSEGTIQFFKSFAVSQIVTEGLKSSIHKRRPNGGCCKSFPSGHSSKAFMGASFIHKRYGWQYSVPAYIAATYVGYSRVHADKHYMEDVAAGVAIGILSSFYFTDKAKGFEIIPVIDRNKYGVYFKIEW